MKTVYCRPMCNQTLIFPLFIFLLALTATAKQILYRNGKFFDSKNRQLTFHGTNIVVKSPPYTPTLGQYDSLWSFGPDDIQLLKDNGFNAIRLGVMWAGVEPNNKGFNQTYLSQMVNIVNMAGKAGIYTLVEFHQDLLSETFCGDGVPIWMVSQLKLWKTFPFPVGKKVTPSNFSCTLPWSQYYFAYDVGEGFNHLYNPKSQLNKRFIKYWQKVAETFKGNPYVIAYELINEPWIGNIWRNPLLIVPSVAERLKLQQFYDQLSLVIRKTDPETPLCFEPVTFDNFVPSGFSHSPGGNRYKNQSVFCYHYYQPPAINLIELETYVFDARRYGIGSMLSETYGYSETLDKAEKLKQSWFYWCYKDFGGENKGMSLNEVMGVKNGTKPVLNDVLRNQRDMKMNGSLIRTFLPRVAGELEESSFNTTSGHFSASYWALPGGETVLFLQKQRVYNRNYAINVYPQNETTLSEDGNYVIIKYNGSEVNKRIFITVSQI